MANRRIGGGMGGGPRGQSFSQQQPFRGSGVNPWQGGSNSNQGLISNPQQLALALSSLLQPQQQSNNPPSLLSLNTTPAFNQNRDFGRFGGRGRDMRRHEPYNKNRGGNWKNRKPFNKKSPNREQPKKKDEVKTEADAEDKKHDESGEGNEDKQDSKEGQYKGVPAKYLNCFVCNKQMWDGESMGKHVRGRAHRQMLESMEESMHLTVNILREHMRLSEEKKAIEWDRMQRISKKFKKSHEPESHCNMCDLKFMGKIVAHRKTEGHQRLKRYLHPNCDVCDKEFSSRMDWVEHRLTPEHLQKLCSTLESKEGGADGDVILDEGEPDLEPILEESLQMEADHPILELTDDLTGLQSLLPAYKPDRAIAQQSLVQFSGFKCQICYRSFENEELSQDHLKTQRHFYNFIEAAKAKAKEDQEKKEKEEKVKQEAEEKTSENGDAEMYDPEEACNENEEKGANDESMEIPEDPADLNNTEVEEEEEQEQGQEQADQQGEVKEEKPVAKPVAAPAQAAKPAQATPAAQANAPARQTPRRVATAAGGAAKNGAGPKSKKARK